MKIQKFDKSSLSELVFLAIFALGLFFSALMVRSRSWIVLTDPIALEGSGLSVSLPANKVWERFENWNFESDNTFVLAAQLPQQGSAATVRWKYLVAAEPADDETALRKMVRYFNGQSSEPEYTDGPFRFLWQILYMPNEAAEVALGRTVLEDGRVLELYVRAQNQPALAQDLFVELADHVQFRPVEGNAAGRALVRNLSESFAKTSAVFLLRRTDGTELGYSKILITPTADEQSRQVQIDYEDFIRNGSGNVKTVSRLLTTATLDAFEWDTLMEIADSGRGARYSLDKPSGRGLTVDKATGGSDTYWPADPYVPEMLLPYLGWQLIELNESGAVVDVISGRGLIVPTVLEKLDPQEASMQMDAVHAAVKVRFLHEAESFEELYFDASGQMTGKYEQLQEGLVRIWEKISPDQILFHFGELFKEPEKSACIEPLNTGNPRISMKNEVPPLFQDCGKSSFMVSESRCLA